MKKLLFTLTLLLISVVGFSQNFISDYCQVTQNGQSKTTYVKNYFSFDKHQLVWMNPQGTEYYTISFNKTTVDEGINYYHFYCVDSQGNRLNMILADVGEYMYLSLTDGNTVITFRCKQY